LPSGGISAPLVEFVTWLQRQYYDRRLAGLALAIKDGAEPFANAVGEWPLCSHLRRLSDVPNRRKADIWTLRLEKRLDEPVGGH
jgi:hypothetical protein